MDLPVQRVGETLVEATDRLRASGSETPRLDADLLLGHVLGVGRATLAAHGEQVLSTPQVERFEACLTRREQGEPVAYIRGLKEFYGAVISVDPRVLIPRPETETLVELALGRITERLTGAPRDTAADPLLVWDVGTGSGAIPVAIGSELRKRRYGEAVRFHVSDLSGDARDVATINVVSHGLAHLVTFSEGDLVDVAPPPDRPVDLLLANLPYIPSAVVPTLPVAASFEPAMALDGGEDGLALIRRLLGRLPEVVAEYGGALLEIGGDQAEAVAAAAAEVLPGWRCVVHPDLSGSPRVAELHQAGRAADGAT
jgi:release factor glutamine methyltransferase